MVFSDFVLFSQALKHPRLYLPFLGLGPAVAIPIVAGLTIFVGVTLEPALFNYGELGAVSVISTTAVALIITAVIIYFSRTSTPTLEPAKDVIHFGLIPSLVIYFIHSRLPPEQNNSIVFKFQPGSTASTQPTKNRAVQPNIIVVQSESFFDARKLHPSVKSSLLSSFDACVASAQLSGALTVPAWGANTMRTEFSFLTGVANASLGLKRFDPYQAYAGKPLHSIASHLGALGYRCVCIHPHPATFFKRDQLFPQLGFHEFIDIAAFDESQKSGPYIGDQAVAEKILEVLKNASEPLFIFAITMENHGPLHLEQVSQEDHPKLYASPPPEAFHDLSVFLRHLKNADTMIHTLTTALKKNDPSAIFSLFGDHVPSMPTVYDVLGYESAKTDYFIWSAQAAPAKRQNREELSVEQLAEKILAAGGL
ncbi:MAG: sulfatase-like hydrolase/transferase [Gammaproteobacteria bacterium]|nr:sulfatase-like hydrolase/transferase [Gammaproteobacteria bacterium]